MKSKTEVISIRMTATMALQLKREAGPHGSVSSVVRSMVEKVLKGKA